MNTLKPGKRIAKKIIEHNRNLYVFGRILENKKLSRLIDSLVHANQIGFYSIIEKNIGYDKDKLAGSIERLSRMGVYFSASINYPRIGIYQYMVFIRNKMIELKDIPHKPWLSSYTKTLSPKGTLLIYYIPYNHVDELVSSINNKLKPGERDYHALINMERRQPSFTKYRFEDHPLITGYSFETLYNIFKNIDEDKIRSKILIGKDLEKNIYPPRDQVDLFMLKEYEKNAFISLKKIDQIYKIGTDHLRKHLLRHINGKGLIKGIYIKYSFFVKAVGTPLLMIIKLDSYEKIYRWIGFFRALDNIGLIGYSIEENNPIIYTAVYKTLNKMSDLEVFLVKMLEENEVEDILILNYVLKSLRKYTLPYKGFYHEVKNWDLNTEKTVELFKKRYLRKRY